MSAQRSILSVSAEKVAEYLTILQAEIAERKAEGEAADVIRFDRTATSAARSHARTASSVAWARVDSLEFALEALVDADLIGTAK
jgi:hypothetical protein